MRVLFTLFPSLSHLFPVVPVAHALQAAGHEVCVAFHEGLFEQDLAGATTAAGLDCVTLGSRSELTEAVAVHERDRDGRRAARSLALDPQGGDGWESGSMTLVGLLSLYHPTRAEGDRWPMVDALVDFCRAWKPDLVLWDPLTPPASVAARVSGAAHARLLWGLDNVARISRLQPPGRNLLLDWMQPFLERYGLHSAEEMLLGQWSVELTPPKLRLPADLNYLPVRRIPYAGATTVPSWLYAPSDRPRVCLTLGMSTRRTPEASTSLPLREVLDHAASWDAEVVATLSDEQLAAAGELPPNVRRVGFMPLGLLLPTCTAIIHHGGGGTFAAAVAHRVPQIVAPLPRWDEVTTGRYLEQRGAGLMLTRDEVCAESVSERLAWVLKDDSFTAGAAVLHRDSMASPSPAEAVGPLQRLTYEHRSRP